MNEEETFMKDLNAATNREMKDDHLTDPERAEIVARFEAIFSGYIPRYPYDSPMNDKFIFIMYEWNQ